MAELSANFGPWIYRFRNLSCLGFENLVQSFLRILISELKKFCNIFVGSLKEDVGILHLYIPLILKPFSHLKFSSKLKLLQLILLFDFSLYFSFYFFPFLLRIRYVKDDRHTLWTYLLWISPWSFPIKYVMSFPRGSILKVYTPSDLIKVP